MRVPNDEGAETAQEQHDAKQPATDEQMLPLPEYLKGNNTWEWVFPSDGTTSQSIEQTGPDPDRDTNMNSGAPSSREQQGPPGQQREQVDLQQHPQDPLQTALRERDLFEQYWKEAVRELNNRQVEYHHKVDDDYFISEWQTLQYEIKIWAGSNFGGDFGTARKIPVPGDELSRLAKDAKAYLQSATLRPALVRAYVWSKLGQHVFNVSGADNGLLWAGAAHESLRKMYTLLDPWTTGRSVKADPADVKACCRWRASTAVLLHDKASSSEVDDRARPLIDAMVEVLAPYLTVVRRDYEDRLTKIVSRAIRLDAEFHKQRARFTVWPLARSTGGTPYSFRPNPSLAELDDGGELSEQSIVRVVLSPLLCKAGNSEGDNYAEQVALCKAQVSVQTPSAMSGAMPGDDKGREISRTLSTTSGGSTTQPRKQSTSTQGSATSSSGRRPSESGAFSKIGGGLRKLFSEPESTTALPEPQGTHESFE